MPWHDSKPWISKSCGVSKAQVEEFNSIYKKCGIVGAEHRPDGDLVCTSRKARKKVMQLRELFDRDAGYGDAQGETL